MATLAESVIGAGQQQAANAGRSVGDAVQAYHIAATAEHARQELDMEKQKTEIGKANWLLTSLNKANNMVGEQRNAMIDSISKQYQKIDPTADPTVFNVIKKQNPDEVRNLAWNLNQMVTQGGASNPDQAEHILNGVGSLDGYAGFLEKGAQYRAMVEAGKARAEGIAGPRLQQLGWNKHKAAVSGVIDNKPIQALLGGYQSIQNALVNYEASGGMVQELSQLQTQLRLNAGGGGTGVAERAEGYAHDLGISRDKVMQILSGNIQSADLSSPKLVQAIKSIAQAEIKNKQMQGAQQIKKHAAAFSGVYQTDPYAAVNKPDFDNAVRQQYGQFGLDENGIPDVPQPKSGTTASSSPPQQEPAVGSIMQGYRYKGGGAHSSDNWEPITAGENQ